MPFCFFKTILILKWLKWFKNGWIINWSKILIPFFALNLKKKGFTIHAVFKLGLFHRKAWEEKSKKKKSWLSLRRLCKKQRDNALVWHFAHLWRREIFQLSQNICWPDYLSSEDWTIFEESSRESSGFSSFPSLSVSKWMNFNSQNSQ